MASERASVGVPALGIVRSVAARVLRSPTGRLHESPLFPASTAGAFSSLPTLPGQPGLSESRSSARCGRSGTTISRRAGFSVPKRTHRNGGAGRCRGTPACAVLHRRAFARGVGSPLARALEAGGQASCSTSSWSLRFRSSAVAGGVARTGRADLRRAFLTVTDVPGQGTTAEART